MAAPPFDPASAPDAALLALGLALKQARYRHVTPSPATHQRVLRRAAPARPFSLTDVLGWSRAFDAADLAPHLVALMHAAGVLHPDGAFWRSSVRVSSLDAQVYFHSAYPTSAADAVFFGPDTYRFVRALNAQLDTAELGNERRVERSAEQRAAGPILRAVDIGCGAGAAAITIALRWPQAAVLALDINDAALRLTSLNAALAGAANVQVLHSNLLDATEGQFDLIVANPPYLLDARERLYRHGGGALGTALSLAIVATALERLAPGGRLLLYTGVAMVDGADPFLAHITPLLQAAGVTWHYEEIDPDVFGEELDTPAYRCAERIAAVWLTLERAA